MIYSHAELHEMLARVGAGIHIVDGSELFCRVREEQVAPDAYGRVLSQRQSLSCIDGDTHERSARHQCEVDGSIWQIIHVRRKTSGIVVWTMERYIS